MVSEECLASPSPEACCTSGQVLTLGTPGKDRFDFGHNRNAQCVFTFEHKDWVRGGAKGDLIHGGDERDHIAGGHGDDVIFGAAGDDKLLGQNGDDSLIPGAGKDHVLGGPGDDTVTIFDLCEIQSREVLDGGYGTDTLVTPVPVEELEALGVKVRSFENIVVQSGSCQSECADVPDCSGQGTCVNGDAPGEMSCECDEGFSGANCEFDFLVAQAGGFAYNQECDTAGVPLPPVWNYEDAFHGANGTLWQNLGQLRLPFISEGLTAEVFAWESDSPVGACIALPRSVMDDNQIPLDDGIHLLGVICQGTVSSKACFWDAKVVDRFETMIFETMDTPAEEQCEIVDGFPNTQYGDTVGTTRYETAAGASCFIGGTDLSLPGATGGTCTNCHRGENVFIVPDINSPLGAVGNRMPSDWHDPIVDALWPQNPGPFIFDDVIASDTADPCLVCHGEDKRATALFGGRFPTPGGACFIAQEAFASTMPPAARRCSTEPGADPEDTCDSGQVCQPFPAPSVFGVCVAACTTAGDCQLGQACSLDADCAASLACRDSKCVPSCLQDTDCGAGQRCKGLACVPSSYGAAVLDQCP